MTDAQRKAIRKYDSAHYTTVGCKLPKEYAALFKEVCAAVGTTPSTIYRQATDAFIADHQDVVKKISAEKAEEKA